MADPKLSQLLEQQYQAQIQHGYSKMRGLNLVICATVRDCAEQLQRNLPTVEKLRACFNHSSVIVVENDSIDGSKDILANYQQQSSNISLLGKDTGKVTIPTERTDAENPWFSRSRIEKMAGFRNQYLEFIEHMPRKPDVMIVLDLDYHAFFLDGIAHSFGHQQAWDMISANGRQFRNGESVYFDTYAYRAKGMQCAQTEAEIYSAQIQLAPLQRLMPLFAVDSAFGGFAIYRYNAVAGHRYTSLPNDDPEVTSLCDHPSLHLSMRAAGHAQLLINPSMISHYNKPKRSVRALISSALPV